MIPLKDTIRSRHFPVMTWIIISINALVFVFQLSLGQDGLAAFVNQFAMVPATWQVNPAWYAITIFTSMFMHSGWLHFLGNMWILAIFGDNVEDRMGPVGFLAFYLLSGVLAGILQTAVQPGSMIPTLGASGAIAGVMGAYIVLYPTSRIITLIPIFFFFTTIRVPAVIFLGIWFFTQFFSGLASVGSVTMGGIAWWAHIGGFVFGLLAVRSFLFRKPPAKPNYMYQIIDHPYDE